MDEPKGKKKAIERENLKKRENAIQFALPYILSPLLLVFLLFFRFLRRLRSFYYIVWEARRTRKPAGSLAENSTDVNWNFVCFPTLNRR